MKTIGVLIICMLTASASASVGLPDTTTLWFANRTDGQQGTGSADDPFHASDSPSTDSQGLSTYDLDRRVRQNYYDNLVIRLYPGTYATTGLKSIGSWVIKGAGMEITTLKWLKSQGRQLDTPYATDQPMAVINYQYDSKAITIQDLTIDCNFGSVLSPGSGPQKVSAINARAESIIVQRVKTMNFGAEGGPEMADQEVFPIRVVTSVRGGTATVSDCIVTGPVLMRGTGGYCTGIMVAQSLDGDGVPLPSHAKRTVLVKNNRVINVPQGIAYGGGYVENALFEGNFAIRCNGGFNMDDQQNSRLTVRNNIFLDMGAGINVGGSGSLKTFTELTIENNIIRLRPELITYAPTVAEPYGILLNVNADQCFVRENIVSPQDLSTSADYSGVWGYYVTFSFSEPSTGHWTERNLVDKALRAEIASESHSLHRKNTFTDGTAFPVVRRNF